MSPSSSLFLTQIALPLGSGLTRMLSDRLSRQRERCVQTEGHPDCLVRSTGNARTHTHEEKNRDSLCLSEKNPLDNCRTRGLHPASECAGNCKNITARLWVAQRKFTLAKQPPVHVHFNVRDIVQVFPQQYVI